MTLDEALEIATQAGAKFAPDGSRLSITTDREMPEEAWRTLAANKAELLDRLGWRYQRGGVIGSIFHEPDNMTPAPAGVECCDRCGNTETIAVTIHAGESTRLDCSICGRFRRFSHWYGQEMP